MDENACAGGMATVGMATVGMATGLLGCSRSWESSVRNIPSLRSRPHSTLALQPQTETSPSHWRQAGLQAIGRQRDVCSQNALPSRTVLSVNLAPEAHLWGSAGGSLPWSVIGLCLGGPVLRTKEPEGGPLRPTRLRGCCRGWRQARPRADAQHASVLPSSFSPASRGLFLSIFWVK